MKKIAILYICTGRYTVFWKPFFESCEKNLCSNTEKHYFIFTDSENITLLNNRIHIIHQKKLGWPNDTLMRFSMFLKVEKELKKFDYIYFFNANLKIIVPINEGDFLPVNETLVVVLHPGYFDKKPADFPYERRVSSLAFIPKNKGTFYFAGGLNGGKSKDYLKFINILSKSVEKDYSRGIVAKWHDESHLNKYVLNKKVKILDPSFLYTEFSLMSFKPKILILDKNHYGGHKWLRSDKSGFLLITSFIYSIIKYYKKYLLYSVRCFFGNS